MGMLLGTRRGLLGGRGGSVLAYDAFADSIVHAYELARRVLSSYTGSLCRLRRDSDNAESDFTYDADNNLDTAAITAWAGGANINIVTVYGQATIGDDITQATAGEQPSYNATAQNGHPGATLGSTYNLWGAFAAGAMSQPFTVFSIAELDAANVNDGTFYRITDTTGAITPQINLGKNSTPDPDEWAIFAGTLLNGGAADADCHIWTVVFNGASSQFWHDGASKASGNAGANAPGGWAWARTGGSVRWLGNILSSIVCTGALSAGDRAGMETAMNAYWSTF